MQGEAIPYETNPKPKSAASRPSSEEPELAKAEALRQRSDHLYEQGKYREAAQLDRKRCSILESAFGDWSAELAACLNNLGVLYVSLGEHTEARSLYERALSIREDILGRGHHHVALSLDNLALLYIAQGDYVNAEPLCERALIIREEGLGVEHPDTAASLTTLALLHWKQGEYAEAKRLQMRALTIYERTLGADHADVATALNNLAVLYKTTGAYEEAEAAQERALGIRERALGVDHPDVAQSLNNMGILYYEQGDYEKTEPLIQRALHIREDIFGSVHPAVADTLGGLASLYWRRGEQENTTPLLGQAELLLRRCLAIRERILGPEHPDVALSLGMLAELYHTQGQHAPALEFHRRALGVQEANLVRTLIVADESRRLAYASSLSDSLHYALSLHLRVTPEHGSIAELALTTLLRRKNRVQDLVTQSTAALRHSLPESDRHLLDDLADVDSQIAVLSNRGPGQLGVEAFSQQLEELGKERHRLWSGLAKHSALVDSLDHPITIEDIQRALPKGSSLIELVQYVPQHGDDGKSLRKHEPKPPPRYAAYLIFPDRFDWVDLGPAVPIDERVKAFRKALQTKQAIPTDLYDAAMRPIVEKLGSARRLVIAPAGALNLIPFGALYDGKRYLVEKYDLRYVTTGRDLLDPPSSPAVPSTPVTVVANPTGAFLPDAEAEADFLEGFFPEPRVLRGKQATETNVRTVERPLILHMATHGFFGEALNERDNPMFRSGLYLADIEQVEVNREQDDGQLTAYEVSGMDLRGTQLVVLSACETGMGAATKAEGKELMSEGVSGLRRAFAMAGAKTTVMSLWEVSGVTAQKTMAAYYRKLAEGQGPGEAMQAVQLEMLRTKEHAHPKDWAVFIVSGDDDPLDFPAGQEPREAEDEQGPPEPDGKGGCATRPSGRGAPGSMLIGLLGLTPLRRRYS